MINNIIFTILIADQMMGNSMDFDFGEIMENRQRSQETIECKEEIMETQTYENRSYPDIALDDTVEKHDEL